METSLNSSIHFHLTALAEGVYAAMAEPSGAAMSNAGIIDTGDSTLVFDTFLTPRAATDLRASAELLTHRNVTYVINSHWHNDHIRGNQSFLPETEIISTRLTRNLIETRGVSEAQEDWESISSRSRSLDQPVDPDHPFLRKDEAFSLSGYSRHLAEMTQRLKVRAPTWYFEGKLVFHGVRQTVELYDMGAGHSENDLVLYLPRPKILFASDLVFVETHPYLGDADPKGWLKALDWIESLAPLQIVPGHGPIRGLEAIAPLRTYIQDLMELAEKIQYQDSPEEAVSKVAIPTMYQQWDHSRFFHANLISLINQYQNRSSQTDML